ncbi:MAG: phosphoglycerate kinase [Alphaproteobacteria bacterium PRO2]|nr:phosphoglycerate kinase [Alphaproteobacteria bacterium PRO2]
MKFKTIRDIDLNNKRVLMRADLNVPAQHGKVTDTARIDRLKPTIDHLRKAGARTLILSHFGRPDGERNPQMSLAFLLPALEASWGTKVKFAQDCIGDKAEALTASLQPGEIAILENVRFHKGEEANDPAFCKELAKNGDIYVNDAFSVSHRAHASTEGLAHLLPAAAGFLMEEELNALDRALERPRKPVAAIAGGSKISTKLKVLKNLVEKVDFLILGGGMANTFLHAQGADIGMSLCEKDMAAEARKIMDHAASKGCKILLPIDSVTVTSIHPGAEYEIDDSRKIPADRMAIDVGPKTIQYILDETKNCKTLVWNGPMGVFEIKPFDAGTNAIAVETAKRTKNGLISVAGGGDTVAALENAGAADDFTYISTAGGAFLEWLEGRTLPGVAALDLKN